MTLIIDLSKDLEAALVAYAQAEGVDAAGYARRVLARALGMEEEPGGPPLKTGSGLLAKYGPAHQPKRLMPIGPICSAVLVRMLRDFGRRGHARRALAFVRRLQAV
jgi:hypothetical protein